MKPEFQFKLLGLLICVMVLCYYFHNRPEKEKEVRKEMHEVNEVRVSQDSCMRPFVDSIYPDSLQWRVEAINQ